METNYRLYAYTGEAQRDPGTAGGGWEWGGERKQEGMPGFVQLTWQLSEFSDILITFERMAQGRLGVGLSSSPSLLVPGSESELQIALIALFSEMLYRFPNMVVAQVTRESVQQAIASGITAQQVSSLGGVAGRHSAFGMSGTGWSLYDRLAAGLLPLVWLSCLSTD